jgi:hypothetical protein
VNSPGQIEPELAHRIRADLKHYSGSLPERVAIAWRGYLAAMLEWHLISPAGHDELLRNVPPIADDPVLDILRGRDE